MPTSTTYRPGRMFHGHLWLPNGKMGIEAFVHNGHDYTYFGLFPSIIRMPILLVTSRLDGQMTAPSILVAWLLTALFSSLMLWRLRILMRGDAVRRTSRSGIVRRSHGHHHGRFGGALPSGDALHLQRGLCLEHPADGWQLVCAARRVGATVVRKGHRQRRADPVHQPQPEPGRLGLLHCSLARRRMVRTRARWSTQPALGHPNGGRRRDPVPGELRRHLRQVRHSDRPPDGRPGLGHRQRPPSLLPGGQRREGFQLRLPAQHTVGLSSTLWGPIRRNLPVHHSALGSCPHGSAAWCSTRPTPRQASRTPVRFSFSWAVGVQWPPFGPGGSDGFI